MESERPSESLDLSSLLARRELAKHAEETARREHRRIAEAIALRMDELTLSNPWNAYAAHVKGMMANAENTRSHVLRQIAEGDDTGDALMKLRFEAKELLGEIRAYQYCLNLPEHVQELAGWRRPTPAPTGNGETPAA